MRWIALFINMLAGEGAIEIEPPKLIWKKLARGVWILIQAVFFVLFIGLLAFLQLVGMVAG